MGVHGLLYLGGSVVLACTCTCTAGTHSHGTPYMVHGVMSR